MAKKCIATIIGNPLCFLGTIEDFNPDTGTLHLNPTPESFVENFPECSENSSDSPDVCEEVAEVCDVSNAEVASLSDESSDENDSPSSSSSSATAEAPEEMSTIVEAINDETDDQVFWRTVCRDKDEVDQAQPAK